MKPRTNLLPDDIDVSAPPLDPIEQVLAEAEAYGGPITDCYGFVTFPAYSGQFADFLPMHIEYRVLPSLRVRDVPLLLQTIDPAEYRRLIVRLHARAKQFIMDHGTQRTVTHHYRVVEDPELEARYRAGYRGFTVDSLIGLADRAGIERIADLPEPSDVVWDVEARRVLTENGKPTEPGTERGASRASSVL